GDVAVPRDQGPHGSHARAQRHECQQQPGVEEQGALHERADRVEGVGEERGEQQRRTRAHQRQQAPEESAEQTDLGHFSFAASSIVSTNVLSGCAPRMGLPLTTKVGVLVAPDRKSTRLNSSHVKISYAVFCLKKKTIASR